MNRSENSSFTTHLNWSMPEAELNTVQHDALQKGKELAVEKMKARGTFVTGRIGGLIGGGLQTAISAVQIAYKATKFIGRGVLCLGSGAANVVHLGKNPAAKATYQAQKELLKLDGKDTLLAGCKLIATAVGTVAMIIKPSIGTHIVRNALLLNEEVLLKKHIVAAEYKAKSEGEQGKADELKAIRVGSKNFSEMSQRLKGIDGSTAEEPQ